MTTEANPGYDLFTRDMRGSYDRGDTLRGFLRRLTPGIPVMMPERYRDAGNLRSIDSANSACKRVGRELSARFVVRSVEGTLWVCRLKPEDTK